MVVGAGFGDKRLHRTLAVTLRVPLLEGAGDLVTRL